MSTNMLEAGGGGRWIARGARMLLLATLCGIAAGCTTGRHVATVGGGAAVGAAVGHWAGDGRAGPTVLGAGAGALVGSALSPKDRLVRREGFEAGYVRGQSDAIKRHYWMRQAAERERAGQGVGRTHYYLVPGPEQTPGGARLEPHVVALPVIE